MDADWFQEYLDNQPTCPYCGHKMELDTMFGGNGYMYRCHLCESTTGIYDNWPSAYEAANKRAEAMWINHQFDAECSECHGTVSYEGKGKYCLNCGRKMTSEKSDWRDKIYPFPPKVD